MKTLVVYCHPSTQSHNARIRAAVERGLNAGGGDYEVLDLYGSGFDPRLKEIEYARAFIRKERVAEAEIAELQGKISEARNLVFIYPVWWYSMPACLKGFVDRVFAQGFAYRFYKVNRLMLLGGAIVARIPGLRYLMQPYAVTPLLKGKRAYIFRSYGGPAFGKRMFGNPTVGLENAVLRFCGITRILIHELYNTNKSVYTQAYEDAYLRKAERIAASIR